MKLKTAKDIEILKEGGKRHALILKKLSSLVVPGVSTQDIEDEVRRLIKEGGDTASFLNYTPDGAPRAYPAAICISINDEIVHGIPNEKPKILKEGDLVSLDLGLTHKGLITDAAITVPVGKIDKELKKLLSITKKSLMKGIKEALPGNTIGDISFAIYSVIKKSGFNLAEDLAGHGVGFEVHEDPIIPNIGQKGKGERLVPGMVIAIEPMVNIGKGKIKVSSDGYTISTLDGSKSAHFEHTIAITDKGNIILTSL